MYPEVKNRKRLIKLAKRIPCDQVREFLSELGDTCFVVHEHGVEVLQAWTEHHGVCEVTIEDDVLFVACLQYLKGINQIYSSEKQFMDSNPQLKR